MTANAYLRARPIADALAAGAQVVVTGRVTDAALVVGPALHTFGWSDDDVDAIAGAVVAATSLSAAPSAVAGTTRSSRRCPAGSASGSRWPRCTADGSSVITKHPGTGGMVTVGTVTAQLLYEIGDPRYLGPDAVPRSTASSSRQEGPDRVRIRGCAAKHRRPR